MKPFFSFVVACCDVEPYIEECLQSVLDQSFQNWECIIGIETSIDRTEEIIRVKTTGDFRFRIFTGPRTGSCSASRNTGVNLAQGEYIIFLDGDDTIADDCLARLYHKICANPDADLYPCVIITHDEINGKNEYRDNYLQDAPAEMTGIEATLYLDSHFHGRFCPMLQQTIQRREFLLKNGLKCIHGLRNQDSEYSPRALYLAKRVVPLHEPYYLYRIHPNSVQTKARGENVDYFMKDWAIITKSLVAFYGRVSKEESFDSRLIPCWTRQWFPRIIIYFFSLKVLKQVPRAKRVEWLCFALEDDLDSCSEMIKTGTLIQKLEAWHIWSFIEYPSLRWYVDFFFTCEHKARMCYQHIRRFRKNKPDSPYVPIQQQGKGPSTSLPD